METRTLSAKCRGRRTPSRRTIANVDCAFVKNVFGFICSENRGRTLGQPFPEPIDTVVSIVGYLISPLLSDLEGLVSMTPRNVIVQRCVGACDDDGFWSSKSCLSTQTVNKTVKVMAFQANYGPGHLRDICTSVQVKKRKLNL